LHHVQQLAPKHHWLLMVHAGLIQAMTETLQRLEQRRASLQQQQQQQLILRQQLVLEQQHIRALLLELTLCRGAGVALCYSSLFGKAAVVLLQAAAAHTAVTMLRSPMRLCAEEAVNTVLSYCGDILPHCVCAQCHRHLTRLRLEALELAQQLQEQLQQQLATALANSEAAASDESAADAVVAAAWDAVLHSEDVAQLAAFQVAAAALLLHGSSGSSRSSSSSRSSRGSSRIKQQRFSSSSSMMLVLHCWLP
jgi:hypothetical protein